MTGDSYEKDVFFFFFWSPRMMRRIKIACEDFRRSIIALSNNPWRRWMFCVLVTFWLMMHLRQGVTGNGVAGTGKVKGII